MDMGISQNLVNLIMGQLVTGTDPRDPPRFVDPFDPWRTDPLSALCERETYPCSALTTLVTGGHPAYKKARTSSPQSKRAL